jgi:hypothetical protein
VIGHASASLAQLKGSEMGGFSIFSQFAIKSPDSDSGRVLRTVTKEVDTGDPVGVCASETAPDNALFSCLVTAVVCAELAVVSSVRVLAEWGLQNGVVVGW